MIALTKLPSRDELLAKLRDGRRSATPPERSEKEEREAAERATLREAEMAAIDATPDTKLDLEKAMALLSLPQRASLTMCFALGYSHDEAAAILEMPVGTLKSHIARGRERVRRLLESER